MLKLIAPVVLLAIIQVQGYPLQQSTSECESSNDCGVGECCALGMVRYSTPQCLPMGQLEDFCREDNGPENRTLFYPNGKSVEVFEIYTHVCPCDSDFQCVDNVCSRRDSYEDNYLY